MGKVAFVDICKKTIFSVFVIAIATITGILLASEANILYAQTPPAGQVAAYGFNEGSGSIAADASGNSNTGTISGATWTTSGRFGNALSFNGTSNRVDINDASSLDLTTGMTLEAWVYPTSSTGWRTIIMKERSGGLTYAIYANNNASRPEVDIRIGGIDRSVTGTAALPLNAWTHLAATYNGTTLRLYVNGTQVGSLSISGSITVSASPLRIGGSTTLSGRYFAGRIDEVRIYNRALSQAEIQSDLNTAIPPDTTVPTPPTNLVATAASGSQINLAWTASTDNFGVTGYQVEQCQGAGCSNFAQVGTATGTTYNNTGLQDATTYNYRVRATDAAGNLSSYSNTASATSPDATPPTAPSNLTASAASESQIDLTWSASTDNVGVTGYQVLRCQGTSCTPSTVVTTVSGTTYSNTGLLPSTSYRYRVRATDAAGNLSSYSNTASATTLDTTPPTAPSNLTASAASGTQINLAWTASTDNVGVTGYQVERCQGAGCSNFAQVGTSSGTTYNNTGLQDATTYSYRVRATDAAGNLSSYSNTASATTPDATPPTPPSGLTASAVSDSQINLAWTASTDNVGVTGYQVERCQGASCSSFAQVAAVSGTSYNDTGLLSSTTYRYRVRATDARGNLSSYSGAASATTKKPTTVVLVNHLSDYYADFQRFIKPYLDNFGIPYNVVDIATTPVPATVGDCAVIIIGHRRLDVDSTYLGSTEQGYISSAVNAGTGLVNFDNVLHDYDGTPLYNYVQTIFNFGYDGSDGDYNVVFPNPAGHYITQKHSSGETIDANWMTLAGITVPSGVTSLATTVSGEPFLSVTKYGSGHAVQWSSYDWMSHDVKGPLFGLDDLVWRSIVWAARKPFVMQGMPPFVTMRMDDVSGPLWWIHIANEFGIIPWAAIFTDDIDSTEAADLSNLVNAGKTTAAIHAFGTDNFFYFDHYNGINFSDATMANYYATATTWFNAHNIPISKYLVPHYYEIGSNVFSGLQNWGVEFIGTMMDPSGLEAEAPWMMKGPYRLYETGSAYDRGHNPYYADYMTIPGHPEFDGKFFNCITEIRDVTGYEWLGNGRTGVSDAIQDGTKWLTRAFDSMALATLFSHEYTFTGQMSQSGWRAVLQGITNNISNYNPIYVSLDYGCQYARAKYNSKITSYEYNPATQQITTTLGGYTDMPTKFYLFYEAGGNIQQALIDVPQFNGYTQVVSTPPPPDTTPPTVISASPSNTATDVSTLVNVTVTFSEAMDLTTINASTFVLRDPQNNLVPASVSYSAATKTATLTSAGFLANSALYTATVRGGTSGVKDSSGNPMAADFSWSFMTESETVLTIWNDGAFPPQEAITDGKPIEVGVKFRSDINAYITGLLFYKGALNTGTHVGHLWNRSGILLASATFTNETASGWEEVSFSTPVPIMANTTYVASYYSPSGYYTVEEWFFALAGADNGPLHALADGVDGPNGVYKYGASGFPTSSWNSSNYWVDVVYATSGPPDTTPPNVYSVSPRNNASGRSIGTNITATFGEAIDPATLSTSTFLLRDSFNVLVSGVITYDASTWTATLDPVGQLTNYMSYTVTIKGGVAGVKDVAGNPMVSDFSWSFTTEALQPPPNQGPGGPILVITSASNPFTEYYAEILRTEGFNAFTVSDISNITSVSGFDVVILGDMPLTSGQATMLSNWVYAGGNLIAMRPDRQLTSLLGLTYASSTLSDAYLLVNTASGPGHGIVNQTMQFHGAADLYSPSGASVIATLYSNATTATSHPAVTLRSVGTDGGQAAAFTYDLARSIVYTRQGNPAWAGQERDGTSPIRSNDLFFGAASYDPQPDWVDLNKVAIPQADEQQRLLANLIIQMNFDKKPLPRFWYFPRGLPAVVIMTGDDHGNGGTAGRFDSYISKSPSNCSVENWECIRSTSYIEAGPLTDTQAAAYNAAGFEVGVHIDNGCVDWTLSSLETLYADQLDAFYTAYPNLPSPSTSRTHCIVWSDYDTQPQVELANGIRLDANYYYWPPNWISNRPGFFTGSGMPMRFAKSDGTLIDVYQVATQMTDESGQTYPFTIDALLDKVMGPEGYYGAFTANMHTDSVSSSGSDAIIGSALTRQIPVISARQMLEWLDGRNGSAFSALTWSGNTLNFTVSAGQNANGLMAMVPIPAGLVVSNVTHNGNPIAYSVGRVKGILYAFLYAVSGSYQVAFITDATPPTVSEVSPSNGTSGVDTRANVTATFSEAVDPTTITASTFVLRDPSNTIVPAQVTYIIDTRTATLDPTGLLVPSTTYTATVKGGSSGVKDFAGNPMSTDVAWFFTTADSEGPFTIWNNDALPQYGAVSDGQPIEVGVKFRSDVNGYITGLRFYKGLLNTGTHVGHLWDGSGNLLASATFVNETASGWQEVSLATSVRINANTTYVASYYSSTGYYAVDKGYFTKGVDNKPLHALAEGVDGGNGVYNYGASGFPTSTYNSNNYWVDVVFDRDVPNPPTVTTVFPSNWTSGVDTFTNITATFSEAIDPTTITVSTFVLRDSSNTIVPAQVTYNINTRTATLDPTTLLMPLTVYTAVVKGGVSGVKDLAGNPMNTDTTWMFTTAASTPVMIWGEGDTPAIITVSDPNAVELGVKFRSDVNGTITGLRFYKSAENTGTHIGNLWTNDGVLLASATFSNETDSGWQQVDLSAPVAIAANTTYVASYHTTTGCYSADPAYFASSDFANSPLRALANGEDGPNGVYRYGAGGLFPDQTYNSTNYWIDVVFLPQQ